MNILVISDIHNDIENILSYLDKVALLNADVIVCPGDFTDIAQKGFSTTDIGNIIIEELKSLKKPIVAVPGNMDGDIISLLDEEKISIHGKGKIIQDVGFYGFGGAKTPFRTNLEPSEEEIETGLTKAYDEVKNAKLKVQVTHSPPAKTSVDMLYTGAHVGSEVVRNFIEEKKPIVAVTAHIHEARGIDHIGETKIINSGRFPEGSCGLITIKNGKAEVKLISLI
jgi:Icc-related predicted phosphoesterase